MKIGIIGQGNIGGSLGARWSALGHDVVYGARDPNSPKTRAALADSGPDARAVSLADAATFGQVVILAVPAAAVAETLDQLGDLNGKIVIDTTNDLRHVRPEGTASLSQSIAERAPGARVIKTFNTMGWETIRDPRYGDESATAFLCGDDAQAKATAMALIEQLGLEPIDVGPLAQAPRLDELVLLFMAVAQNYGRNIAFRVLRRQSTSLGGPRF